MKLFRRNPERVFTCGKDKGVCSYAVAKRHVTGPSVGNAYCILCSARLK